MHECFTYQIEPLNHKLKETAYFKGKVYKAHWLVDSVREGSLLGNENYLSFTNDAHGSASIQFQGK